MASPIATEAPNAAEASPIAVEASIRWNSMKFDEIRCFGRVWEASGGIWEASGRHLETSGRYLEASGRHLGGLGHPLGTPDPEHMPRGR